MIRKTDFIDEGYRDADVSLLKKLTLVIPTYNRSFYFSRSLWYHAHFPFGQIIVADSSQNEIKNINKETVRKIKTKFGRDIVYLEYEPESEKYGGDIYRKWWDALSHSRTEYSLFCTDKEFIIPPIATMGIDYLDKNTEYICAFGNRVEYIKSILRKKIVAPFCTQSYEDSQAIDRLNKLVTCHTIPENLFQIYRTDIKIFLNQNITDYGIDDFRYGEIAAELLPLVYGKIKQFDVPGRVRDLLSSHYKLSPKINKNESSTIRYPSLVDYPKNKKEKLHNQLIQCFSESKSQTDQSDISELNDTTKRIIEWWMKKRLDKFSLRLKYFISKQLPDPLRKIIAISEKTTFTKSPDINKVRNELKIIKKSILEFDMTRIEE